MISPYLANQLLGAVFRGDALTAALGNVYLALHRDDPGSVGEGEFSGRGYGRQAVRFDEPSLGTIANRYAVEFPDLPSGTVTYVAFWDAATGGRFLWGVPMATPKVIGNDGDRFRIPERAIDIALGGELAT
jgi:hypothetical protein